MTRNVKIASLALLVAAVAVPVGGTYAAEDKDRDPAATKTVQDFKQEVRQWLMHESKDKKSQEDKIAELKTKYEELFKALIKESRVDTGTRELTDAEILAAIDYISYETIKDEKRKIRYDEAGNRGDTVGVAVLRWLGIPVVDATCPTTTDPNFRQVRIDIDGGRYGSYSFNGDNDLYLVTTTTNPRTCEKTYDLYFKDEDHPFLDAFYDNVRQVWYQRVHDIESFTIKNNRVITFDDTWSSTQDYDGIGGVYAHHYTTSRTYTPGQTVYVSNTWNHMMDTLDTNGSLAKVRVP